MEVFAGAGIAVVGIGILAFLRRRSPALDAETLTYGEAVAYFVDNRPIDESVKSGAILREKAHGYWQLVFVFLDQNGGVCTAANGIHYGRKLRVRHLDEELMVFFSDKDLLIFQ